MIKKGYFLADDEMTLQGNETRCEYVANNKI